MFKKNEKINWTHLKTFHSRRHSPIKCVYYDEIKLLNRELFCQISCDLWMRVKYFLALNYLVKQEVKNSCEFLNQLISLWNWVGPDDMNKNVWNPKYFNFIKNKHVYFWSLQESEVLILIMHSDFINYNNFSNCFFLFYSYDNSFLQ